MPSSSPSSSKSFVQEYLPPDVLEKLEAGAFRSLRQHLEERSAQVSNIDLMTLSGFCRNCLAKWMVLEARRLAKQEGVSDPLLEQALNALGYDEAAQYVYGCDYKEWKKRYLTKATDEQMKRYQESESLHAKHDKELLKARAERPTTAIHEAIDGSNTTVQTSTGSLVPSNVCCQDVEQDPMSNALMATVPSIRNKPAAKQARALPAFVPPPPPATTMSITTCILTVSDRASQNLYDTGDLSGPAVEEHAQAACEALGVSCAVVEKRIVPDNVDAIQKALKQWCNNDIDVVWTTGGTGFGPRDVTPEATTQILDRECKGLMSFVATECSKQQPLASLSRGTAGVLQNTLIVNLPGNPKGVGEIFPVLLPVLLHAIHDMQASAIVKK